MDKPKRKRPRDFNVLASVIVKEAIGEAPSPQEELSNKNPHAVALGHLGGLKGGKARAEKLTPKERIAIAKKAAQSRWQKK